MNQSKAPLSETEIRQAVSVVRHRLNYHHWLRPEDWLETRLYGVYPWISISLMASIDLVLFGPVGLVIFALQMLWIPFWAAGVINGLDQGL